MGRRQSLDTSPDGRVPCLLSRGPWLNVCVRAGRRKVELGFWSWGQEELTSSGEVREGILASWEPDLGDACICLGCQEAKPPERPGKASPPPGRGAGSQLARKPRATPDCAALGFHSRGRVRVERDFGATRFLSPHCAVCQGLPGQLDALKASDSFPPLAGFGKVCTTSSWHPRLNARPHDLPPCAEAASSISSRSGKGRGPGHPLQSPSRGTHETRAARTLRLLQSFRAGLNGLTAGRGLLP